MNGIGCFIAGYERAVAQVWTRPPDEHVWQWAAREVDFSLAPNYDTPIHGPFDPEYMPYWKEVSECLTDNAVREIAILKATRAGGSENVLLNAIRYAVAVRPQPTLYVTSDQLSAERFMDKRIKRGMRCSTATARALRQAQATQHDIAFPTMDFRATWPRAKQAFKQDGWALVLCDEVSTWPDYSADMARRRTDSYPFPHIVFLSSPDPAQRRPSDDDPIFVEYRNGDQRRWRCPDPAGGWFTFEMGSAAGPGLHWDKEAKREDGTWDYDGVAASAHYLTPGGARIENTARMDTVRAGRWEATNPSAKAGCRSYHVNSFMVPFKSGDFGEIAVAFLKAKAAGSSALRGFVYEYLAEPYATSTEAANDDAMFKRCAPYKLRETASVALFNIAKNPRTFVTVDVQKAHLWALVREWYDGGDSGLLDYGYVVDWSQVEDLANKYKAERVGVDCGYATRAAEVYEYAIKAKALPLRGSDSLQNIPVKELVIDPWEGKRAGGENKVLTYLFNADTFKSLLLDMMRGEARQRWAIPDGVPMEYILQAGSEEKVDGVWRCKRGRSQNHLADCETMQLVMAYLMRIYRNDYLA
jgi:phage terminase large subunit GpA-like protein